jgi:hypothetical protein
MTNFVIKLFINFSDIVKFFKFLFVKANRLKLKKGERKSFGPFEFYYRISGEYMLEVHCEEGLIGKIKDVYQIGDEVIPVRDLIYGKIIYNIYLSKLDIKRIDSDIIIDFKF